MMLQSPLKENYIACFENGWCGPAAVVAGLQSILNRVEETVLFVAAVHPKKFNDEAGEIRAVCRVGIGIIEGVPTWRVCNETGSSLGFNSYNLCNDRNNDLASGAAYLVQHLLSNAENTCGVSIYRQPDYKLQTAEIFAKGYKAVVTSYSYTQHSYSIYADYESEKGKLLLAGVDATEDRNVRDNGCRNPYLKSNWTIMNELAKFAMDGFGIVTPIKSLKK